jgi:PAS domain-containing protein
VKTLDHIKNNPFIKGGGEMGKLTREHDWSLTPIGSPDQWPQSLRTTVSNLLHSKFPMFLWWGDELIQFYNDAYRPSLGKEGKHPTALGQKGKDCWPEIWETIYPLILQVKSGGNSTWMEDQLIPIFRNGQLEDVYWTFSYSPAFDEEDQIQGVLVTCMETTTSVLERKKLVESEDQLRFAIEAAELGTWDYNPLTNQFTGNERLKKWFGLSFNQEIDLSLAIAVIVPKDRDRVKEAIQNALAYDSGGQYDIEYSIINSVTNQERIVRAKGKAWFNKKKQSYRFNGTLQDVTAKTSAYNKLKESDDRFHNLIYSSLQLLGF